MNNNGHGPRTGSKSSEFGAIFNRKAKEDEEGTERGKRPLPRANLLKYSPYYIQDHTGIMLLMSKATKTSDYPKRRLEA